MMIQNLDFSENELRDWLRKIVSVRSTIIRLGKNCKGSRVLAATDAVKNWLDAYPNAPLIGLSRFILKHNDDIAEILPGKGSTAHEKFYEEFEAIRIQSLIVTMCMELNISITYNQVELKDYQRLLHLRDLANRYKNEIRTARQEGIRIYYTKKLEILTRDFNNELLKLQKTPVL